MQTRPTDNSAPPLHPDLPEVEILGVRLHNVDLGETLSLLDRWIHERRPRLVVTPNVDHVMRALSDPDYAALVERADLAIPDGMGVVYASRLLGTPLKGNVAGRLLVEPLCRQAARRRQSVFLLGSAPGVARRAARLLQQRCPRLVIAGTHSPSMRFGDDPTEQEFVVRRILAAQPDILLVGLGAPKQEKFIERHRERLGVPVSIGVGATFDVLSGHVREAPAWMTRVGLEWLWRIGQEPRRLWRRYLVTDTRFVGKVLSYRGWRPLRLAIKRAVDLIGATVGLVLLAPLFLIVSIAIKTTSPGPVFYRWQVVGQGGRRFTGYKFRSMVADADAQRARLERDNEMSDIVFKMERDPRITRVGAHLRRYSIDELPQLWSVLKGDMSLVGPRPPLATEYARFRPWHRRKLAVKPGLTCTWQVSGRNGISDFDTWVRMDLEYIDTWSLGLDARILLRTIPAVLTGRGAS